MFSRFFIDRPIFAAVLSIFIVIAGLASGDRVIVDGVMKIGPGSPVAVAELQPRETNPAKNGTPKAEGRAPVVAQK